MSDIVAVGLLALLYCFIVTLMITVAYKKTTKRRHKAKMKKRLKLIKGEKVGK